MSNTNSSYENKKVIDARKEVINNVVAINSRPVSMVTVVDKYVLMKGNRGKDAKIILEKQG